MVDLWTLNPQLVLRWARGALVAQIQGPSPSLEVQPELMPLLAAFAEPTDTNSAIRGFLGRYEASALPPELTEQVRSALAAFQSARLILPIAEVELPVTNFSAPSPHILMLADHARTLAYRDVLSRLAAGKVCAEIGCGSGILSCFAVLAGASHVYAIEESSILDLAREIAALNGVADRITFIPGNSLEVELPRKADLIFSELIGTDPLCEGIQPALLDARARLLAPNGRMVPLDLSIWTAGVHSPGLHELSAVLRNKRLTAHELGPAYGLDLSPLVRAYEAELDDKERNLGYELLLGNFVHGDTPSIQEAILTEEALVLATDFSAPIESPTTRDVNLTVSVAGELNAMLTYFKCRLDERCTLTTSPFAPQPLKNWRQLLTPITSGAVVRGDVVEVTARVDLTALPNLRYSRRG
ncbi:MAG: hypothetical protein QOF21_2291 [Actinomycetota bacterium]